MKFIDWFAGIGGFRRGMELAGHECVGFCEFDKYAVMSYTAMHLCTQEQLDYLATLPMRERQEEILKEEYRNGEWYANDVRRVYAGDVPEADCWCFGFPCQDISNANKLQLGFRGSRSSLFFRIMYILGQTAEEKRPTYLFIENVKNLLSVNGGWDFARLLIELDEGGTMRNGRFSILKTSECHTTEKDVSLLQVLEVPTREEFYPSKAQRMAFLKEYNAIRQGRDTIRNKTDFI